VRPCFRTCLQFDFLGNGDTVFGDARCAEGFVENDVTAFRAERDFHGVCERVDTAQHALAGVGPNFTSLAAMLKGSSHLFWNDAN
jgi:hypothetical protein